MHLIIHDGITRFSSSKVAQITDDSLFMQNGHVSTGIRLLTEDGFGEELFDYELKSKNRK